jgi:sugar O-acyltransferase (sialic acid O-acetyltransferase NeuD family)
MLAIIGWGALGKQFFNLIKPKNCIAFDDSNSENHDIKIFPFDDYISKEFKDYNFLVALGYKHLEKKLAITQTLLSLNRRLATHVHYQSIVNETASINSGSVIYPMSNIDMGVKIGNSCLVNNSVTISHDSVIQDCCFLSPGVVICGNVFIDKCTFVGAGSIISNNIKIGKGVTIGVGSVITQDIPDHSHVIGNPQRFLEKKLTLR